MATNGFRLARLCARGPGRPDADIVFGNSLNVISGASDTGKSYLFNCIEYMLGRENPPESVPEDSGYDTLYLELHTYQNDILSLQRSLKQGGHYLLYNCPISDIDDSTAREQLRWKHTKERSDTLPARMMSICDLSKKMIRKDKRGTTRLLHFSDVRHFSMINEKVIIDDRSPVWPSGQYPSKTVEESVFNFILSGEDSSSVIAAPDVKIAKAGWRAKAELLETMISEMNAELADTDETIEAQLDKIQLKLDESTSHIESKAEEIEELLSARRDKWKIIQSARSRMAVIQQLRARFTLLTEHYNSDLERLRFVSESDFYLSQVGAAHCPVCGTLLDEHAAEQLAADKQAGLSIQDAARGEARKIDSQLSDLESTVNKLAAEEQELNSTITKLQHEIDAHNKDIEDNLDPEIESAKADIQTLVDTKSALLVTQSKKERLELLRQQLQELGGEPKLVKDDEVSIAPTSAITKARRKFSDAMEVRLSAWNFPDVGTVEFDSESDIVINGQARRTHGKGIRALIHAAFTITLMTEFKSRHSHLVILDSPLTSFKEKDAYEMSEDVQLSFYKSLQALSENEQVIVFENKDPADEIQDSITYYHFSGAHDVGRQGFYPSA